MLNFHIVWHWIILHPWSYHSIFNLLYKEPSANGNRQCKVSCMCKKGETHQYRSRWHIIHYPEYYCKNKPAHNSLAMPLPARWTSYAFLSPTWNMVTRTHTPRKWVQGQYKAPHRNDILSGVNIHEMQLFLL